jgi:integrase
MASIRYRFGTNNWFACFTDAAGRRVQCSTGTRDRKLALKIACEFESVAQKQKTEAQVRRVMSALHEDIHGTPLQTFTVREYFDHWKLALGRAVSASQMAVTTKSAYESAVGEFLAHLDKRADKNIAFVTPATVIEWRDAQATRLAVRTAKKKLKCLGAFFTAAFREGLLPDGNPVAKVDTLEAKRSKRREFKPDELAKVLAAAKGDWLGMTMCGLYLGQRLSDLAGLTWDKIDMARGAVQFDTGKTGRFQDIPIAPPLRDYFATLKVGDDPRAPVFPTLFKYAKTDTQKGDSSQLSKAFRRILEECKLVPKREKAHKKTGEGRSAKRPVSEISFHSLRHTLTTLLKLAGVAEAVVHDIVGHDSEQVSRNYTHVSFEAKQAAFAKLPGIK